MIRKIANHLNKFVWLWIHGQGKTTPAEIMQKTGLKHRSLMKAIAELSAGGYIIRLSAGLYCAAECTECAAGGTISAAGRTDCAAGCTCAAGCIPESAAGCTDCAAGDTASSQRNILNKTKQNKKKEEFFSSSPSASGGAGVPAKFEKNTDRLFDHVDPNSERFLKARSVTLHLFSERNISSDLVDRITAGVIFGLPGCDQKTLEKTWKEGCEARRTGRIDYAWIHMANWIRKVYENDGWEWTKCRSEKEKALQELTRMREAKAAAAALAAAAEPEPKIKETSYTGRVVRKKTDRDRRPEPEDGLKTMAEALKALTSAAGAASGEAGSEKGPKRKAKTA